MLPPLQELVIHPSATGVKVLEKGGVKLEEPDSGLGLVGEQTSKKKKRMTGVRNKIGVFQAPLDIT